MQITADGVTAYNGNGQFTMSLHRNNSTPAGYGQLYVGDGAGNVAIVMRHDTTWGGIIDYHNTTTSIGGVHTLQGYVACEVAGSQFWMPYYN